MKPVVVLLTTLATIGAATSVCRAGTGDGGGGNAAEIRIDEIRRDILDWIIKGGANGFEFRAGMNAQAYATLIKPILEPHAATVIVVTTRQENDATDPELKVSIDGQPKTCRGFVSVHDGLPRMLCNQEQFESTSQPKQYRLIHHEYAGLVGIEHNIKASSDYAYSDQITDFLVPEVVLRLAVARRPSIPNHWIGEYKLVNSNGPTSNSACSQELSIKAATFGKRSGITVTPTEDYIIEHIPRGVPYPPRGFMDPPFGVLSDDGSPWLSAGAWFLGKVKESDTLLPIVKYYRDILVKPSATGGLTRRYRFGYEECEPFYGPLECLFSSMHYTAVVYQWLETIDEKHIQFASQRDGEPSTLTNCLYERN